MPRATIQNTCRLCIFSILHSLYAEPYCSPRNFAEKVAEFHFGRIKAEFRGKPSIRDGVMATQKKHLENLRKQIPNSPASAESPLSLEAARTLCKASLKTACLFQSYISVAKGPEDLGEDLVQWWQKSGATMLSKMDPEDEPEDSHKRLRGKYRGAC